MRRGYKVLISRDKQLKSVWVTGNLMFMCNDERGKKHGITRYITNKWTVPKKENGPLCVFRNKRDAIEWARTAMWLCPQLKHEKIRIYRCFYEPSKLSAIWVKRSVPLCGMDDVMTYKTALPPGTELADRVMITSRLL